VLSHENHADYESLVNSLMDEHLPAGATEQHLIEELASVIWRKRRVLQAEGATINKGLKESARNAKTVIPAAAPFEWACLAKHRHSQDLMDLNRKTWPKASAPPAMIWMRPTRPAPSCAKVATAPMTKPCAPCCPIHGSGGKAMWRKRNTPPMPRVWPASSPSTCHALCCQQEKESRHHDAIVNQTIGEGLQAYRLEKLSRYETHLDRKFERTLAMLIKLKDLRSSRAA
jgi:hypothetical protein